MKKALNIFATMLAVILLCGVTVSCSKDNNEEQPETTSETILMFFPYSGLSDYIKTNISGIKNAIINRGGLGNKRIVVCQALSTELANLYEITYQEGVCRDKTIADKMSMSFSGTDQSAAISTLQEILLKTKQNAPADSYSMIIGCHGSSWIQAGTLTLEECNNAYSTQTGPLRSFGTADSSGQIDNLSLVTALQNVNIHLKYLLFDACYMASIETVYDFHNICDYYFASQNEILDYGVPYDKLGDALLNNDYKGVVDKYNEFYSSYSYPLGSFTLIDCKYVDDMAKIIQKINNGNLKATASLSSVQVMDGLSPAVFFDLSSYLENNCTDATLLNEYKDKMDQLVLSNKSTAQVYTAFNTSKRITINTHCGLNTSQPTENTKAAPAIQKTSWWIATH